MAELYHLRNIPTKSASDDTVPYAERHTPRNEFAAGTNVLCVEGCKDLFYEEISSCRLGNDRCFVVGIGWRCSNLNVEADPVDIRGAATTSQRYQGHNAGL